MSHAFLDIDMINCSILCADSDHSFFTNDFSTRQLPSHETFPSHKPENKQMPVGGDILLKGDESDVSIDAWWMYGVLTFMSFMSFVTFSYLKD